MTEDLSQPWDAAEWNAALEAVHGLIGEGRFEEALTSSETLLARSDVSDNAVVNCAGFLIDLGNDSDNDALIARGVSLLEGCVAKTLSPRVNRAARYNLANGLDSLGRLELEARGRSYWTLQENEKCRRAKHLFAGLLEDEGAESTPEHWTNYGNRLSLVGRKLEALYAYDQALQLDPDHPMAKGNKGEALECIAPRLRVSAAETLHEAGRLIAQAIDSPRLAPIGGPGPRQHWTVDLKRIEGILKRSIRADEPRTHKVADLSARSSFMQRYLALCRDERLFLTYHLCDEDASAALRDDVFIETLEKADEPSRFPGLAIRFNQIKEDYAVARYLLFLSQDSAPDRDAVNSTTIFADLGDGTVSHLNGGLLKAAFGQAFDILDKIAFLLNEYLGLGIPVKRTSFRSFWRNDEDLKKKVPAVTARVRESLRGRDDYGIVSLVDLALDIEHERYKRISDLRNAQTHRCLVLTKGGMESNDPDGVMRIDNEAMTWETLRILRMVKSAIFSLAVVVSAEERRQAGSGPKTILRRDTPNSRGS
jgi:tetratricopeptide (TPR) repeat protein